MTFAAPVGGINPLASLTTSAGQTTINGGQVRTTDNQTYGGSLALGAPTTLLTTANGSITANGSVAANGHLLTLAAGLGNVVMQNATNDFSMVSVTSAATVALYDANDLTLNSSGFGMFTATAAGMFNGLRPTHRERSGRCNRAVGQSFREFIGRERAVRATRQPLAGLVN